MINDFGNFSWSLFATSGQLGYYMMYKAARELEEREEQEKFR